MARSYMVCLYFPEKCPCSVLNKLPSLTTFSKTKMHAYDSAILPSEVCRECLNALLVNKINSVMRQAGDGFNF